MKREMVAGALALLATAALAATWTDSGGTIIGGAVMHWLNGSNVATPVSTANPLPVNVVSGSSVTATPTSSSGAYSSATVGTSSASVLAASTAKIYLDLTNNSAAATVCVNFGATATISGTVCAAGEITLPPLSAKTWEGSFVPSDQLYMIASAASTPVTIGAK